MKIKLDKAIPLSEIKEITDAVGESESIMIENICTDTRLLSAGDLFWAIRGEHKDGNDFLSEAAKRGAFIICEKEFPHALTVKDTRKALLITASYYKSLLKDLKITVAITGSVGKTTTKELMSVLLSKSFKVHKTKENLNNSLGLSYTILSSPIDTEVLILEMGMNHMGEISLLSKYANPNIAIITNIGSSHIGNLGSRESIAKAKLEIKDGMTNGPLLFPYGERLLNGDISFSAEHREADVYVEGRGSLVKVFVHGSELCQSFFCSSAQHMRSCLSAAVCAALTLGIKKEILAQGISEISADKMRHRIYGTYDFYVYEDCYNASAESVLAAANDLVSLNEYRKKSICLGDIEELEGYSESIHFELGRSLAALQIEKFYLFGRYSEFVKKGLMLCQISKSSIFTNTDVTHPEITAEQIHKEHEKGEIILFKASRAIRLERVIEILKKA